MFEPTKFDCSNVQKRPFYTCVVKAKINLHINAVWSKFRYLVWEYESIHVLYYSSKTTEYSDKKTKTDMRIDLWLWSTEKNEVIFVGTRTYTECVLHSNALFRQNVSFECEDHSCRGQRDEICRFSQDLHVKKTPKDCSLLKSALKRRPRFFWKLILVLSYFLYCNRI